MGISHHEVDLFERCELFGIDLGITTGCDYYGVGVLSLCPVDILSAVAVGSFGDGAGVYHVDIRLFPEGDFSITF